MGVRRDTGGESYIGSPWRKENGGAGIWVEENCGALSPNHPRSDLDDEAQASLSETNQTTRPLAFENSASSAARLVVDFSPGNTLNRLEPMLLPGGHTPKHKLHVAVMRCNDDITLLQHGLVITLTQSKQKTGSFIASHF